jgi:nuclear pore complex protein Nup160
VSTYIPEDEFSPGVQPVNIITLADMRGEYTAVLAQLRLSQQIQNLHEHGVSLTPEEIVGFFTQRSMFDEAQSSAAAMDVDMSDLFTVLATRCVELARAPGVKLDNPAATFLASSPVTSRLRGPPAALALRYLQVALERHDSAATEWRYRAAVADTLMELNDDMRVGWQMPAWLVDDEMARDAEGWISRALAHGWVPEAVAWTADMLRHAPAPDLLQNKDAAADGAYNLVDRVLAAAGAEDAQVQDDARALKAEVGRRIAGMRK